MKVPISRWSDALLEALMRGSEDDRRAAMVQARIIDSEGRLLPPYDGTLPEQASRTDDGLWIEAERATLKRFIEETPDEDVIDRGSLIARLESLDASGHADDKQPLSGVLAEIRNELRVKGEPIDYDRFRKVIGRLDGLADHAGERNYCDSCGKNMPNVLVLHARAEVGAAAMEWMFPAEGTDSIRLIAAIEALRKLQGSGE